LVLFFTDISHELRRFIIHILEKDFNVLEASDGKQGMKITLAEIPDIIISDIMMPEMDGIEYLQHIKGNKDICHIPVILLSAKSSIEDRIKGLAYGADDYISKPFNSAYLKARVQSLLKQREMLYSFYINHRTGETEKSDEQTNTSAHSSLQITTFDNGFMNGLIAHIEENIQNPEFKIDDMAEAMHMSRTVFYRKIKSLVGVSPIDLVKNVRLKHAIQLLDTSDYSISEIAYMSGFATPQYFSKVFKSAMNCPPKDYKRKTDEKQQL